MAVNISGSPSVPRTSLTSPLLQVAMVAGLFVIARWSAVHAPEVRSTDQFAYYALSAVSTLLATLFLPFSLVALGVVVRNRRRQRARAVLTSGARK